MLRLLLLSLIVLSCSKVEIQNTCLAKFQKIEQENFFDVSERELASHDNDIKLGSLDYGKKHFKTLKELEKSNFSCFQNSMQSFSFSKAVLDEIDEYPKATQKKVIKEMVDYIKFRVDSRDNTLEHNTYIFGLLRKATKKGFFLKRRNRIILKMRELSNKWDKIKGIKDPKSAKLQSEILYQVSRGHILEIVEKG